MRKLLFVVLPLALMSVPLAAAASPRADRAVVLPPYPTEGKGCYFRRGRQHCGRYCYVEVNGRRYCQERARDAVPQADFYEFWEPAPSGHRGIK